eukprot:2848408-Pleurochrysis_carterae.AAC.2
MVQMWKHLSKSEAVVRPSEATDVSAVMSELKLSAKLDELAIDIIDMQLSTAVQATVWEHTGELNELKFEPVKEYKSKEKNDKTTIQLKDVEVFLFRAYYDWADEQGNVVMFDRHGKNSAYPCSGTTSLEVSRASLRPEGSPGRI